MAAATAASALLRRSSRTCPWLSSFFYHKQECFFFPTSPYSKSFGVRTHALRSVKPSLDGSDSGNDDEWSSTSIDPFNKSRNELKREARRAVRWGMTISTFSPLQIKRILSAASLEREVLDAVLLVKRLGPDVREGKRRQFNYIGRLLRKAEPELMDALIQASRDGDDSRLQYLTGQASWCIDDNEDDEENLESELEEGGDYAEVADKWLDGLIYEDTSITKEVYSLHTVDFDRQELRKLVRRVQSIKKGSAHTDESGLEAGDATFTKAKKLLLRFLRSLAKNSLAELYGNA